MIDKIELPVGTRFKALVGGEMTSAVVEEGSKCRECVFKNSQVFCVGTICAGLDRDDNIPVYFRKVEGGEE